MMPDKNELVERLYRLHFKKLFIYANAVLRDPEQAKDVVQDTFHEALRRIDVFAKHENPGGWLMNTLKNKLKENERTRRRDLLRLLSLDADFPDESNLPEELVAAQPEPQEESVIEKVERVLTPEEYQLLKRLVFDRASHWRWHRSLAYLCTPVRNAWSESEKSYIQYFLSEKREGKRSEKVCQDSL